MRFQRLGVSLFGFIAIVSVVPARASGTT